MKTKNYIAALLFVAVLALYRGASAEILQINGTIHGMVNGEAIQATAVGALDTSGILGGSATITFSALPSNFHPAALSWSLLSVNCGDGIVPLNGARNLFDLTAGNYTFDRTVTYPSFPNSELRTVGSTTTSMGILSYDMTISGNYDGPTNLIGVTDYASSWEFTGPDDIFTDVGGATIMRTGGSSFSDRWVTEYGTGGSALPGIEQISMIYTTQNFDGTVLHLDWHGTVVPEPATMALLGLGGLGMLRRRRRGN